MNFGEKKKVTSSQVAEKAGVSQATVSMILNRRNNVSFSEETIEKVERAARELGYELPHRKHKNNKQKRKTDRCFCPTLTSPYYVLLLQGIESVANEKDMASLSAIRSEMPDWKSDI